MNGNRFENGQPQSEYDKENAVDQEEIKEQDSRTQSADEDVNEGAKGKSNKNKETARLEKALAQAIEERDSFRDSYQRTFSDYNNYKKRNQSLTAQAMKAGASDVIEKILPVLDNLERALEHVDESSDNGLEKGVSMVYRQLLDVLESFGVKEIPALGCEFDPNFHQAIQQVEAAQGEASGMVSCVALKGYTIDDRVIRHSMVIVNK